MNKPNIAIVLAILLALVSVAGCRPQPPSPLQIENWSQQKWSATVDGHDRLPARTDVEPVQAEVERPEPMAAITPVSMIQIDLDDARPGDMPSELLSPAELDRLTLQIGTRQHLARWFVLEAWLQHRVSELEQAEWDVLERSSQPSGCGVSFRERLANIRLHLGRAERELNTMHAERLRCENSLNKKGTE